MTTEVFKIVSAFRRGFNLQYQYHSLMAGSLPGASVEYTPGKIAVPIIKGSKLFAFDNYAAARAYVKTFDTYRLQLWRCDAEGVAAVAGTAVYSSLTWSYARTNSYTEAARFWKDFNAGRRRTKFPDVCTLPAGSVFCDSIKLVERVEFKEDASDEIAL